MGGGAIHMCEHTIAGETDGIMQYNKSRRLERQFTLAKQRDGEHRAARTRTDLQLRERDAPVRGRLKSGGGHERTVAVHPSCSLTKSVRALSKRRQRIQPFTMKRIERLSERVRLETHRIGYRQSRLRLGTFNRFVRFDV